VGSLREPYSIAASPGKKERLLKIRWITAFKKAISADYARPLIL